MILDEYVEVSAGSRNIKYYTDLGYQPYIKNGKKYFKVKVNDLQHSTGTKILVKCDNDNCEKTWLQPYKNYLNIMKKYGTNYCHDCQYLHNQETCLEKYGVTSYAKTEESKKKHEETYLKNWGVTSPIYNDEIRKKIEQTNLERYGSIHTFGSSEIRDKAKNTLINTYGSMENFYDHIHELQKQTNLEKYGSESYLGTDEWKEKTKNTNLEKYGCECVFNNKEVQDKIKNTIVEKYGVDNPFKSEIIKDKIKKTNLDKYGYEQIGQVPSIREKILQSLYANSSQKTSSQQLYFHELLGGELNYPCKSYSLDIFLPDYSIDVEIDFGGHDLGVKTGKISQSQFKQKELIRDKIIKSQNIKIVRFISPNDKMPSDDKIIEAMNFAIEYLKSDHTWINFYIEENKYRNAEYLDESGCYFDFGELWNGKILSRKEVGDI